MERRVALPPSQIVLTGAGRPLGFANWARRLVSICVFGAAALALTAGAVVWLPLALLVDAARNERLATTRALAFLSIFFVLEMAGVFRAAWIWLRYRGAAPERFAEENIALQRWWTTKLQRAAFGIFRISTEIEGAEACRPGPLVAMFRHVSVADTLLPMMLIGTPHRIALRWVLKSELLWDPCMDIVGNRLRNCFVSRMPETSAEDVAAVGTLMNDLGETHGVAIYPEGTRFSHAKRQRLIDKLGDAAAAFEHVLPPRLGGALALLENNGAHADVIFCAHTGFEGVTSLGDLWRGALIDTTLRIRLWRVPYAEIPNTREERIEWLLSEWKKVDDFVARSVSRP